MLCHSMRQALSQRPKILIIDFGILRYAKCLAEDFNFSQLHKS